MAVRIQIFSLFSYVQLHVQPAGLSVTANNKVISIEQTKLNTYSITLHFLAGEYDL